MKRLKRCAKQRQLPNRPHKLHYKRSCTTFSKRRYAYSIVEAIENSVVYVCNFCEVSVNNHLGS